MVLEKGLVWLGEATPVWPELLVLVLPLYLNILESQLLSSLRIMPLEPEGLF